MGGGAREEDAKKKPLGERSSGRGSAEGLAPDRTPAEGGGEPDWGPARCQSGLCAQREWKRPASSPLLTVSDARVRGWVPGVPSRGGCRGPAVTRQDSGPAPPDAHPPAPALPPAAAARAPARAQSQRQGAPRRGAPRTRECERALAASGGLAPADAERSAGLTPPRVYRAAVNDQPSRAQRACAETGPEALGGGALLRMRRPFPSWAVAKATGGAGFRSSRSRWDPRLCVQLRPGPAPPGPVSGGGRPRLLGWL